jgi:hypothetical protein
LSRGQWRALRQGLAWTRGDRPRSLNDLLEGLGLVATSPSDQPIHESKRTPARSGPARGWLITAGLGLLAFGLYVAWVRLAPDSASAIQRDDTARFSTRSIPAGPVLPDSFVTHEALVPPDLAAVISQTPAPTPVIVARGPGRLGLEADTITVSESAGAVPLHVVRRGGADGTISFTWRTLNDSALADQDYAALGTGTESIGPGETSKTFFIPIVSDAITESTELFDVVIEDPTAGATLGPITQVTVIVVDDD